MVDAYAQAAEVTVEHEAHPSQAASSRSTERRLAWSTSLHGSRHNATARRRPGSPGSARFDPDPTTLSIRQDTGPNQSYGVTVVVAVAELFPGFGSGSLAATVTGWLTVVQRGFTLILTTNVVPG